MGKFIIKTAKNGKYYFTLHSGNGEIILKSQGYAGKKYCKKGIASVKKNAPDATKYIKGISKNKKHFFNLKAGNQKIIGTSEMYESEKSVNTGITSVKRNAPTAATVMEE
ncbi:MAG: YegP family protein [Arachidicoccus sp.]|nr:YegP family protein [Arachidicoccus sp.]